VVIAILLTSADRLQQSSYKDIMANAEKAIRVYQELARGYNTQGQDQVRDRFLVLAADAALGGGRPDQAEQIREQLLDLNPHHLLKPFTTLSQALQSVDVQNYVEGLRRTYPLENAEQMLQQMRQEGEPPMTLAPLPESAPPRAPQPPTPRPPEPPPKPSAPIPLRPVEEAKPPAPAPVQPIPFAPEPAPSPAKPAAPPSSKTSVAKPRRSQAEGNWLATALFTLVLTAALALVVYTLIRPFL
jgi:hypothetical protein